MKTIEFEVTQEDINHGRHGFPWCFASPIPLAMERALGVRVAISTTIFITEKGSFNLPQEVIDFDKALSSGKEVKPTKFEFYCEGYYD